MDLTAQLDQSALPKANVHLEIAVHMLIKITVAGFMEMTILNTIASLKKWMILTELQTASRHTIKQWAHSTYQTGTVYQVWVAIQPPHISIRLH